MSDGPNDLSIVHVGVDEAGSLTADTPFFVVAAVLVTSPGTLRNVFRRAALRSGKHLGRSARSASEIKWSSASERMRWRLLDDLASLPIEVFALTALKAGRRIEDTPANYGALVCELMALCWPVYSNVALSLDRHFTSAAQVAAVNTLLHRYWPRHGILSIGHVDSQRSTIVQCSDIVAGSIYSWHKSGDAAVRRIEGKISASLVEDWRRIKARWSGPME